MRVFGTEFLNVGFVGNVGDTPIRRIFQEELVKRDEFILEFTEGVGECERNYFETGTEGGRVC